MSINFHLSGIPVLDKIPASLVQYGLLFCTLIGAFAIVAFHLRFFIGIYNRLLRGGKDIKRKYGSWAIVTGATDGIGKAMALEFARKGLNVIIISRTLSKLQEFQSDIINKYPKVEVKILDIDYGNFNEEQRERIVKLIDGLDIGCLVNNVGVSYPYTQYFHELTNERVDELTKLNIDSTTWMTRIVLPNMIARKTGSIVNISSAAGVSTSPLLAQYGAAKSYIAMFSKALNAEYKDKGIHVQCQVPMFVATKLAKIKRSSLFVASPSGYARAAVAAIGYETIVSPFWTHALQIWVLTNFPEWLITWATLQMHHGIRKAGQKKEASESDKKSR